MRILEAQSAVLSNYEVFQHLIDQRSRYKQQKRRGPPNLETVVTEPVTYSPECIGQLVERLRPYDLSKGEIVMILNLRPASMAALNTIIEDRSDRFSEDQQEEMVNIVAEVLGRFEAEETENQEPVEEGDETMDDAAA